MPSTQLTAHKHNVIHLANRLVLRPFSETGALASTDATGLCSINRSTLHSKQQVRISNGVIEVLPGNLFRILISNFNNMTQTLPKGMLVAYDV